MKLPGWSVLVAAVVLVFLGMRIYGCEKQQDGKLQAEIDASKERVRLRDSVIVTLMAKDRQVTVRYLKADTVWQKAKREYEADPGDSTKAAAAVNSCSVVELTCRESNANLRVILGEKDATILEKNTQIKKLEQKGQKHWGCAGPGVASREGVDLGIGCGYVVHFQCEVWMPETELHKLIRYGYDFVMEERMAEIAALRHDNRAMRRNLRKKRKNENRRKARKRRRA